MCQVCRGMTNFKPLFGNALLIEYNILEGWHCSVEAELLIYNASIPYGHQFYSSCPISNPSYCRWPGKIAKVDPSVWVPACLYGGLRWSSWPLTGPNLATWPSEEWTSDWKSKLSVLPLRCFRPCLCVTLTFKWISKSWRFFQLVMFLRERLFTSPSTQCFCFVHSIS